LQGAALQRARARFKGAFERSLNSALDAVWTFAASRPLILGKLAG